MLQTEVKRLQALVRLEKDTVLALQQALEETKQSWGASESEANTALATSHSFEVSSSVEPHCSAAVKDLEKSRIIHSPRVVGS